MDDNGRRAFLKALGLGAASLAACERIPVRHAMPLLVPPEEVTPGVPTFYASTCSGCSAACGTMVKVLAGRPVKLEGNNDHPLSRGGLCAIGQAELRSLYDPSRLQAPTVQGEAATWDDVDAYEQTKEHRADGEPFFFVDGPPYTSGAAHMGHAWNKSLKDAYIRYHRMQGRHVPDRPGYDMHGLPIETKVEEQLGFSSKKDIVDYGEDAFIEACKDFADDQLEGHPPGHMRRGELPPHPAPLRRPGLPLRPW